MKNKLLYAALLALTLSSQAFAASLPSSSGGGGGRASRKSGFPLRFYVAAGYSLNTKASYPSTHDSLVANTYLTEVNYNDNVNLEVGMVNMPNYAFGFTAGVNYELTKKIKDAKQNGSAVTVNDASIQVTNIMAGTTFRFDNVYIPLTAMYSLVNVKADSTYTGTTDASGGIGGQTGLGVLLTDKFAFEWLYRYNTLKLKATAPGQTVDFGNGTLTSFDLMFKYYF